MSRSGTSIPISKGESMPTQIDNTEDQVRKRAYELFVDRNGTGGGELDDWLAAEQELIWKPLLEITEKNRQLTVQFAAPGLNPQDLALSITPDEIRIQGDVSRFHCADGGTVHLCEFRSARLLRSERLPMTVDPDTAKAEYRDGMVRITAAIAKGGEVEKKQTTAN